MKVVRILTFIVLLATFAITAFPATASSANTQPAEVFTFADLPIFVDVGDSWLSRNDNGITTNTVIYDAAPGVYTMWWVVWNTPEGCFVPYGCLEPDFGNPNVGLAVGYAGGAVAGPNGMIKISAHLNEGDTLHGFPYPEFLAAGAQLTETTLIDSRHAEIHLVFRSHGDFLPRHAGMVASALHTFNGGCNYDPPITGSTPAYGTPGPNTCVDQFFAVFGSEDAP